MKYELNQIKVVLENYKHLLRGRPKLGKTTLYRNLILEAYGRPDAGLLISPSNETGFRAIDNLYAIEAPVWRDFVDIVDDLVDNKEDNNFKMICIDTIDALVEIATDKVMQMHLALKGERAVSLNAALGGYSAGQNKVCELINDQVKRLETAQYGIFFIGHCKLKKITDPETGMEYEQVVGNLESRFDSIFISKADIVCTMAESKQIEEGKLIGTTRNLYYRANSFIDAGSRLAGMPDKSEWGAKEYIQSFEQGVKGSYSTPVSDEVISKIKQTESEKLKEDSKVFVGKTQEKKQELEKESTLSTAEEYISAITAKIKSLDADMKAEKQEKLKKAELPQNYKKLDDLELLKKYLIIVSE